MSPKFRQWITYAVVLAAIVVTVASFAGLLGPSYHRPGLFLPGEVQTEVPSDWSFTREIKTIAVETRTPYLLPHSVVIACGDLDGNLYVGAQNPDTKRWPAWVDRDPNVRLGIDSKVYEVRLVPIDDPSLIKRVNEDGFYSKYPKDVDPDESRPPVRLWRVAPRI